MKSLLRLNGGRRGGLKNAGLLAGNGSSTGGGDEQEGRLVQATTSNSAALNSI